MRNIIKSLFMPDLFADTIYDIDIDLLKKQGVKAVIFDIDNTLVPYSAATADEKLVNWMSELKNFGFNVILASNNNRKRVNTFARSINCDYISRACKPLGFRIKKMLGNLGIKPEQAAFTGDQLFTDVLSAKLIGTYSILVHAVSDKENWFIKIKRIAERRILGEDYEIYRISQK